MADKENKGLDIPADLLDRFANMQPGPDGQMEDPDDTAESSRREYAEEKRLDAIQGLNDTLTWLFSTLDDGAKQLDYPGLGKVPPEKLGKLWAIILERNLSHKVIEKTPEAAGVSITLGIIGQNYFAHRRKQQQPQPEKTEEDARTE